MKKMNTGILLGLSALLTVGCATKPSELSATYVSPMKYGKYDCEQITMEMGHVSHRTSALYTSLDKKASNDAAAMGIGMILFWPALFALDGGDGPEAVEYSNLKGEYEALRHASVAKKCDLAMLPKSPEKLIQEYEEQKAAKRQETDDIDV